MNLSPDQKIAGLLAPLFALRSETDLGIGDTRTLIQFVDWAASAGFGLVQLLPINETGADNSPYMAVSSVALDPASIHISPGALRDLSRADFEELVADTDLAALNQGAVNYRVVKPLKLRLLRRAFENFEKKSRGRSAARRRQFEAFLRAEADWINGYALFRVLMDENGVGEKWDDWPADQQSFAAAQAWLAQQATPRREAFARQMRFYQFVQWLAFTQWRAVKAHCDRKGVALMGDVPFGVSYYSADVWSRPELFDLTWSGGAPPERVFKSDPFTEKWGQNWGIPLYRWDVMRAENFRWWRRRVHTVREMFHLFRIDHVLGFYRIYSFPWRPERNAEFLPLDPQTAAARAGGRLPRFIERDDATPENRAANRAQGEEYLRVLCEEVGTHRLIGEDLGVVPDYVRPSLAALGIAGFKIPQWERTHDNRLVPGRDYPRLSVTTWATHDHPPLRVMWEQLCADAERGDGRAQWEVRVIAEFCNIDPPHSQPWNDRLHESLLRALFNSNAWLAIVMITDLFGSSRRFNVPGAIADSNWSERLEKTVRAMTRDRAMAEKIGRTRQWIAHSGRTGPQHQP